MFKANNEPLKVKKIIIFLCTIPFVMAAVGGFYITQLENVLYSNIQYSIKEVGAHAASVANESLIHTTSLLKSTVDSPTLRTDGFSKDEIYTYLREAIKKNGWYDIIIADLKGAGRSINGINVNVANRSYFKDALQGQTVTSSIVYNAFYGKYFITHATPILNENNTIKQILIALEVITDSLFLHGLAVDFNMDSKLFFVDAHGSWVAHGEVYMTSFWNFLALENKSISQNATIQYAENIEKNASPFLFQGVKSYLSVSPIGSTGWSVVGITPSHTKTDNVKPILTFSVILFLGIFAAMVFCMAYLYRVGKAYTSYRNFSHAVTSSHGIFYFYLTEQGLVHNANEYFYAQLGLSDAQKTVQILDYAPYIDQASLLAHLKLGKPFVLNMVSAQGKKLHIQCTVMPQLAKTDMYLLLGIDISSYKASREVEILRSQHHELQQVINALPHALLVHSADGIRLANKAALRIIGVENVDEMREGILYGMDSDAFAEQVRMIQRVLTKGSSESNEFNFIDSDGVERVMRNVQSPVFDDDGHVKYAVNLCEDISDTLRLQKQLKDEVQRLHEILDSCPSGFFYTNERVVHYCNPTIQAMMGLEVGKPVPLKKLNLEEQVKSIRDKVENGINVYDEPMSVTDIYGQERHLSVTSLGTTWYGKWHSMVWAYDVTAIHKVQKELIDAKDAAESATRAKSDFLATMSHEIRTPLNAVLGFLHVFEKGNLNQTQKNYINKITISAKGLLRIINDILDFSKIEANKMDLEYTAFNLRANMDAVYSIMSFTAQDKGLTFTFHMDEDVPSIIMGDGERLNQVLLNLLSNAIKFTAQGSIALHIRVTDFLDNTHFTLQCSVSDTGIGLSEEQANNLFKPFSQADTSTSRRFGGTGLGLVISQRIMHLMGGDITLNSELNKGSTFTCTLPVRVATLEEQQILASSRLQGEGKSKQENEEEQLAQLRTKHVLVVEDNMINQEIAAAMLEEYGLTLDFADNGQEAVKKVQEKTYDLIFMDLQMPVMNGFDATSAIRQLGQTLPYLKTIPIIAMTANVMTEDKARCDAVGMNDHVGKPIMPQHLRACLLHWLT